MEMETTEEIGITERDPYLGIEEAAERLGISLDALIRRVESGDVPSMPGEAEGIPRYWVRLSDLGAEDVPSPRETALKGTPAVPPPRRQEPVLSLTNVEADEPRGEVSSMSIDARELVSGMLDRWEHTLEQRIYTEQRQRFEAELTARQNRLKELRLELQTVRAEHAADRAEQERAAAEHQHRMSELERALAQRDAEIRQLTGSVATLQQSQTNRQNRRFGWFFGHK